MSHLHYRTCPLCEATCGLSIEVEGENVKNILGDKDNPFSRGYVCPKGRALGALHADPDRLRTPLVKRDGRFVPVSYSEAFAHVDQGLRRVLEEHGRSSIGAYLGNPTVHNPSLYLYTPSFLRAMKSSHIYSASSVDQLPKQYVSALMFGTTSSIALPDIDRTDYLLMLGANPFESNGSLWTVPDLPRRVRDLQTRGGRLVVIDPRRTRTAKHADEHHFIRPGSDALFLFALTRTIFENEGTRLERYEGLLSGLERVRELAEPFTPEVVSGHCGIAAEDIRRLARELSAAERGVVYGRMGTCTQAFGSLSSWLVDVLNILTGNLDREGGAMFALPAGGSSNTRERRPNERGYRTGRKTSRVRGLPQIMGEFPASCLAEEMETPGAGQLRLLFTIAGNPAVSVPGSDRISRALAGLDFMVSIDMFVNQTTRHADVIFPAISPLEDSHFDYIFQNFMTRNFVQYSPAIFEKPTTQLYEWQVLLGLTQVLGGRGPDIDFEGEDERVYQAWLQAHPIDVETPEARTLRGPDRIIAHVSAAGPYGLDFETLRAKPHGIDLGALKPRLPAMLKTASGQIEMAPPALLNDVPRLRSALEGAPSEFVLIGRRHMKSNNSWMNSGRLADGADRTALFMNAADADRLGLEDGGLVRLSSAVGSIGEARVAISDEIMPGVVSLPHGWSSDTMTGPGVQDRTPGPNVNVLSDPDLYDVPSGNAAFSGVPVQVLVADGVS